MQKLSLDVRARELLERAAASSTGRGAETVYGGQEHTLGQTLIALRAGTLATVSSAAGSKDDGGRDRGTDRVHRPHHLSARRPPTATSRLQVIRRRAR
ncbi:hypothetical protein [Streptomyces sp. AF1A]|jgi:hypothetical protein|uniref:hypothetical protein n=1 Tax=Streptomyces sp. AF1A TaxID=3394350 RepID=UPI0039BD5443